MAICQVLFNCNPLKALLWRSNPLSLQLSPTPEKPSTKEAFGVFGDVYWELLVVKLVNFLIYLLSLVSFEFFLSELICYYHNKIRQDSGIEILRVPEWIWRVLGYTLFIWSSIKWLVVYRDTPDILVSALVYFAAGLVLRLYTNSQSWLNFISLGIVLGIGYLSKSIMLPLAIVFLVTSLFSGSNPRRTLLRVLAAMLVFTIISAPFITALSLQKGRLTFGDAGKLNYAWYVSPKVSDTHWQGLPPGSGTPKHPTRKIYNNPTTFEFATPVAGTFPPWYDPSYWNEGLKPTFNPILQVKCLVKNLLFCCQLFLGSLTFSYLILVCVSGRFSQLLKDLMGNWMLLLPALVGLGGFVVLTNIVGEIKPSFFIQTRYIAPFVVLLFTGIFTSVRLPDSQESKRWIVGLTIATLFITSSQLFYLSAKDLVTIFRKPEHIQWQITNSLSRLGLQSGEKVALLGQEEYYWARLSKVKIVASIPDIEEFWKVDALARSEALKAIEKTGARAIVQQLDSMKIPDSALAIGWQQIGNSTSYIYFLPQGR